MKALLLALLLCPQLSDSEIRRLICDGPTQNIRDNDPGLRLIRDRDPGNRKALKVALAIERENNCPRPERADG